MKPALFAIMLLLLLPHAFAVDLVPVVSIAVNDQQPDTAVLTAIATDSLDNAGIEWIKIYEDGILANQDDFLCGMTATCSRTITIPDGDHLYSAVARDRAGNEAAAQAAAGINRQPRTENLLIDSQDTAVTVTPVPGSLKRVSITAIVSDRNGVDDIDTVIAGITGGPYNNTPVSMGQSKVIDAFTAEYSGWHDLFFYEPPGQYSVTVTATDSKGGQGSRTENFEYLSLVAIELDASAVDFGTGMPGADKSVTGDLDIATTALPTIRNIGNVRLDTEISGTDLTGAGTIPVANVRTRPDASGFIALSQSPQMFDTNLAPNATSNIDFILSVPSPMEKGMYQGSIIITGVSG
jgi:hypothetical protein